MMKSTKSEGEGKNAYVPDDRTLHSMYETARQDKINSEMHQIKRSLVVDTLLIVICIGLFVTHWRWVRKLSKSEA
jgi:Cu/Ag efflux pump CusA